MVAALVPTFFVSLPAVLRLFLSPPEGRLGNRLGGIIGTAIVAYAVGAIVIFVIAAPITLLFSSKRTVPPGKDA